MKKGSIIGWILSEGCGRTMATGNKTQLLPSQHLQFYFITAWLL